MSEFTRRSALGVLLGGTAAGAAGCAVPGNSASAAKPAAAADAGGTCGWDSLDWTRGIENKRKADLGNGTYLNPVMSGDHPDPSILKDGDDYYMTFSTFDAYPGLIIWHSMDLVNWQPIGPALTRNVGSIWAPELTKHGDRYFLYIPSKQTAEPGSKTTSWVIYTDDIRSGTWSDPIDLDLPRHIDPGHARYISDRPKASRLRPSTSDMSASAGTTPCHG